jgi:hypothetical protein
MIAPFRTFAMVITLSFVGLSIIHQNRRKQKTSMWKTDLEGQTFLRLGKRTKESKKKQMGGMRDTSMLSKGRDAHCRPKRQDR